MIDRASPVPLYFQVAQHLQQRIESGTFMAGDALPTEEELQRIYGVSRATVRQAVRQLSSAGLVRTARPYGTFVLQPKLVESLPTLVSFSDEVRLAGLTPSTRVLHVALELAPEDIRRRLNLCLGESTLCVTRLRLTNESPIALMTSWLITSLGIGPDDDFAGSLYHLLAERGVKLVRAEKIVDASNATSEEAALLEVPRRAALLVVSGVTYDATDRPVEYFMGRYRADRYRYSISLHGVASPTPVAAGLVTVQSWHRTNQRVLDKVSLQI